MDIARPTEFLEIARQRRLEMMRSTCRVTRPVGEVGFDPATGELTPPETAVVYEGVCHVMSRVTNAISESYRDFAGAEVATETMSVAIPWDAPSVENGDSMEFLTSDDQWLVDRGPRPIGWVRYADSKTHRVVFVLIQDRPEVPGA